MYYTVIKHDGYLKTPSLQLVFSSCSWVGFWPIRARVGCNLCYRKIHCLTREFRVKVAEHNFRAVSSVVHVYKPARLLNSKTNSSMCINWFTHCFFSNEMNLRNPRATDRGTKFNAAHLQLLQKFRPFTFAETCRFLTIQSLEFQEISPKNSLETTWMICEWSITKKPKHWHREFLILLKTIYGELLMSKFYWSSVERRDFMSIRSGQKMKKI